MTREEAQAIVDALVKLREAATDEMALAAQVLYPVWREGVSYTAGKRIRYNGILYTVLQNHSSQAGWTPDVASSLFAKVLIPDMETILAWEQPDSTNPYMQSDKVMHNGKTWVSDIDGNVWEPGVYGWSEVAE